MKPSELVDMAVRLYKEHQLSPTLEEGFLHEIERPLAEFSWEDLYDAFCRLNAYGVNPNESWKRKLFSTLCNRAQNDTQVIKLASIWEQEFSWDPNTFWGNEKDILMACPNLSELIDSTLPETVNEERKRAKAFFQAVRESRNILKNTIRI
jgi:hypothetical protein